MPLPEKTPPLSPDIDSCQNLYLREIREPHDNKLRLLAEEASGSGITVPVSLPHAAVTPVSEIRSYDSSRLFELSWQSYIAYSVRDECYAKVDPEETIESGRLLRIYFKSKFLDYVRVSAVASDDHPGPAVHIEIVCLNHAVDVISTDQPTIRRLRPGE